MERVETNPPHVFIRRITGPDAHAAKLRTSIDLMKLMNSEEPGSTIWERIPQFFCECGLRLKDSFGDIHCPHCSEKHAAAIQKEEYKAKIEKSEAQIEVRMKNYDRLHKEAAKMKEQEPKELWPAPRYAFTYGFWDFKKP